MNHRATGSRAQLFSALALLAILLLFALFQRRPEEARAFDLSSAAPNGWQALRLWLDDLGYVTDENSGASFAIPASTTLFLIPPTNFAYETDEAAALAAWVSAGGSAVIIGPRLRDDELITTFGVKPGESTPFVATAKQQQPLIPAIGSVELAGAGATLDLSAAPATIPLLVTKEGQVTAAVQRFGEGTVWHLSGHHSLVNEQLRDPAQAKLVLTILHRMPTGATIEFDTYHQLGAMTGQPVIIRTMQEWLYYTSWGWSLLFAFGLSVLTLFLQGRRLGPPLPVQTIRRRREAAEYVVAMANLSRRARHHHVIADHHKLRLKRALGHRTQVDARLDDDEFVERIAIREAELATATEQRRAGQIRTILRQLDQAKSDQQLVTAVDEVDRLLGHLKATKHLPSGFSR